MENAGTRIHTDGSVHVLIPLKPYTKKNSQQIFYRNKILENGEKKRTPFVSPSGNYAQYEKDCRIFMQPLGIDYPVNVQAHFYMDTRRRVDLTNLNEALHDALVTNGLLCEDNCRIIVSTDGSKVFFDKENPRTEICITRTQATFPDSIKKSKKTTDRKEK